MKKIILVVIMTFFCFSLCSCKNNPGKEPIAEDFVDFTVDVEEGREIRVLQLTDTQIIDASQARPGRTGVDYENWVPENMNKACFKYITQVVNVYKPDLIIMTGDLVYGEFDDAGTSLIALIEYMDSLQIPWAPVFGNHDNESKMGVDWQCDQLEYSEYCLFKQREICGNGNYTVGLKQGGKLVRVFYMMDSNGCGAASGQSLINGHTETSAGISSEQIDWFLDDAKKIKRQFPSVKLSLACHIQPAIFATALEYYNYSGQSSVPIDIDGFEGKREGDFGYIGSPLKNPWDTYNVAWEAIVEAKVDSVFVGHEHCNSSSVVFEGVRLAYGLKTGLYDRANYRTKTGEIISSYSWSVGEAIVGGTAITLSSEGEISDTYHIYYDSSLE